MKTCTLDIEANNLYPEVTIIHCAVAIDHDTKEVRKFYGDTLADLPGFLDTVDVLIGHNVIYFDLPTLRKVMGYDFHGTVVDTLQMSRLQRPNRLIPNGCPRVDGHGGLVRPHGVEAWAYRLGLPKKIEHEDWGIFSPEMLERCTHDVEIQYGIYDALLKEGEGEGWEEAHKLNARLFTLLQKQEDYGWLVDREHMDRCILFLERWIARIARLIAPRLPLVTDIDEQKKAGVYGWVKRPFKQDGTPSQVASGYLLDDVGYLAGPFSRVSFRPTDPDSNDEIKNFLLASGWEPAEWNTNNDGEKTSAKFSKDDEFVGVQGGLGKLLARRIQCRQRKGILEGWVDVIRDDGRIGSVVNGIAATGRLKHSVIVNVPSPSSKAFFAKQMRSCFISKSGFVLVGTDSKSNQIRQLASRMNDPGFTAALEAGVDPHEHNRKMSGVPTRTLAKNVYYGYVFGIGDAKLAKLMGKSVAEAKAIKLKFNQGLPYFTSMLEKMKEEWRQSAQKWYNKRFNKIEYQNGYIRGLDGRPILVAYEKDILCYYLQSDEAIQMGTAYCILHKWLERAGFKYGTDYGFCIWMHDEFQIEARGDIAADVAWMANESIAWAGRYYKMNIAHEGESKYGESWYATH